MENRIQTYKEFYSFYLNEHSNKTCRLLHVIGTGVIFLLLFLSFFFSNPYYLIFIPIAGYGFAWFGHFVFEKNKPATFKYPLWSLKSDFKMFFDIILGKIRLDTSKDLERFNTK